MIQFNLLPSVKMDYIKAKRTKRIVFLSAAGTIVASVFIVVILVVVVFVWQNVRLNNLEDSIENEKTALQSKTDINKVLTVQNQLASIDALHESKPEVGRVFTYLSQVTPSKVTVDTYNLDLTAETPGMSITGQTTSLEEVNKFVDTLKFTTMTTGEDNAPSDTKPFTQVVLSSFGRDDSGASFTITLTYDPVIFSSTEANIKLVVPKITSTRSETEQPTELFKENLTPLDEDTSDE